jgi:hypothetical protein
MLVGAAAFGYWARDKLEKLEAHVPVPSVRPHGEVLKLSVRVHSAKSKDLGAPGSFSVQRPFLSFAIGDKCKQTELGDFCRSDGGWRFDETLTFAVCLSSPPMLKLQLCARSSAELGFMSVSLPEKMLGEVDIDLVAEIFQHFSRKEEVDAIESGELWETGKLTFPRPAGASAWEVELSFAVRVSGGQPWAGCGQSRMPNISDIGALVPQVPALDKESITEAQESVADTLEEVCEAVNAAVERLPRFKVAAARVAERRFLEAKDMISQLMTPQEEILDYGKPISVRDAPPNDAPTHPAGESHAISSPATGRSQSQPSPAEQGSQFNLPAGWKAVPMQGGRVFYHHHESGVSQWHPPPNPV